MSEINTALTELHGGSGGKKFTGRYVLTNQS